MLGSTCAKKKIFNFFFRCSVYPNLNNDAGDTWTKKKTNKKLYSLLREQPIEISSREYERSSKSMKLVAHANLHIERDRR